MFGITLIALSAQPGFGQIQTPPSIGSATWKQLIENDEGTILVAHAGTGVRKSTRMWVQIAIPTPEVLSPADFPEDWKLPKLPVKRVIFGMDVVCDPRWEEAGRGEVGDFSTFVRLMYGSDGTELIRQEVPSEPEWTSKGLNHLHAVDQVEAACGEVYAAGRRALRAEADRRSAASHARREEAGRQLREIQARKAEERSRVRTDPGTRRSRCEFAAAIPQSHMPTDGDYLPLYIDSCGTSSGRPAALIRLEIERPGEYALSVTANFDSYLRLFDARGRMLLENDDTHGYTPYLQLPLAAAVYYVEVSSVRPLPGTGSYRLHWNWLRQ